jgi:hypothetical protein
MMTNWIKYIAVITVTAIVGVVVWRGLTATHDIAALEERLAAATSVVEATATAATEREASLREQHAQLQATMGKVNEQIQRNLTTLARANSDIGRVRDSVTALASALAAARPADSTDVGGTVAELGELYTACRARYRELGYEAANLRAALEGADDAAGAGAASQLIVAPLSAALEGADGLGGSVTFSAMPSSGPTPVPGGGPAARPAPSTTGFHLMGAREETPGDAFGDDPNGPNPLMLGTSPPRGLPPGVIDEADWESKWYFQQRIKRLWERRHPRYDEAKDDWPMPPKAYVYWSKRGRDQHAEFLARRAAPRAAPPPPPTPPTRYIPVPMLPPPTPLYTPPKEWSL